MNLRLSEKKIYNVILIFLIGYLAYSWFFVDRFGNATLELGPPKSTQAAPYPLYPAPALKLPQPSGGEISLSQFKGQPVVVVFWAPWCPPCRRELPWLEELAKKLGSTGKVISVATGYRDRGEVTELFDSKQPLSKILLLDEEADASADWKVGSFPTAFIVDPYGIVRYRLAGARHWDGPDAWADIEAVRQVAAP